MPQRILIIDTSVLCCLLKIPGKETAGSGKDKWDFERINKLLVEESSVTRVLPLATIIETGNHISNSPSHRHRTSTELGEIIAAAANAASPWAAFADQADLWTPKQLLTLSEEWPSLAIGGTSIGDATIKQVAEFYAKAGYEVEILTGDSGLKAYQPIVQPSPPRRRS